jgi:hypothetical protein
MAATNSRNSSIGAKMKCLAGEGGAILLEAADAYTCRIGKRSEPRPCAMANDIDQQDRIAHDDAGRRRAATFLLDPKGLAISPPFGLLS